MITRIVKMTFEENKVEEFLLLFDKVAPNIRSFNGCHGVKLLQDLNESNIMFTYSHWANLEALDNYRNSDFFASTWKSTKKLFIKQAEAWSVKELNN